LEKTEREGFVFETKRWSRVNTLASGHRKAHIRLLATQKSTYLSTGESKVKREGGQKFSPARVEWFLITRERLPNVRGDRLLFKEEEKKENCIGLQLKNKAAFSGTAQKKGIALDRQGSAARLTTHKGAWNYQTEQENI